MFGRRLEPLENRLPRPAIRSPAGLEPAHVSATASNDDGDPAVAIVVAGSPVHDRVVVRMKREEGYADCVELVVARRVCIVCPLVRKGERRGGAGTVDRDDLVKLAHHQPLVGVREERREGLCEGRVGELSDRVDVPGDDLSQVRAEGFSVGGPVEPGELQAAFTRLCGCVQSLWCQIYWLSGRTTVLFWPYPRAGMRAR